MEKEVNAKKMEAAKAALEKANKEAGYDIPLAFAALNAAVVNEQTTYDFGMFAGKVDIATIADVMVRGLNGRIDSNTLAMLMETAMAYGWHWATEGESLLRSDEVLAEIDEFIDNKPELTIEEKVDRKKGLEMGFAAIRKAVEKTEGRLRLQREVKVKG